MTPGARDLFDMLRAGGGDRSRVYRIACARCGAHADASANGPSLPPEAIANLFRARGWGVSLRRRADHLCADCAGKSARHRGDTATMIRTGDSRGKNESAPPPAPARADPPPMPTREDKRIIFAKLEEVYLDESRGYSDGWTDHKVAGDLNVPRAWVAMVRDDNFGPDRTGEELRALTAEIAAALAEAQTIADELRRQAALTASQIVDRIEQIAKRQRQIAAKAGVS